MLDLKVEKPPKILLCKENRKEARTPTTGFPENTAFKFKALVLCVKVLNGLGQGCLKDHFTLWDLNNQQLCFFATIELSTERVKGIITRD